MRLPAVGPRSEPLIVLIAREDEARLVALRYGDRATHSAIMSQDLRERSLVEKVPGSDILASNNAVIYSIVASAPHFRRTSSANRRGLNRALTAIG